MTVPPIPVMDEPDIAAAELALDLLEGEARVAAQRRMLADPGFAADVGRWRARFATWFAAWPDAAPPADGLARLERVLSQAANDQGRQIRRWRGVAILSGLVAACLLLFIGLRPPAVPKPAPTLLASIASTRNDRPIAALYDFGSGHLALSGAAARPPGKSAQLWIIGADGVPHSLGLMAVAGPTRIALTPENRERMRSGSVVAISLEPRGGSPGPAPTGPVVATGILSTV